MATITGTSGDDYMIYGTPGDDVLQGLAGDDNMWGDKGDDVLDGGDGQDTVVFDSSTPVTVDLSIVGPQQTGQGRDTFISIEAVAGGEQNDVLRGSANSDVLNGAGGNDVLEGRGGADTLSGEGGNDILRGGDGEDTLTGGPGDDFLYGDGGADRFIVGPLPPGATYGEDYIDGGEGIDTLSIMFTNRSLTVNLGILTRQQAGAGMWLTLVGIENVAGDQLADQLTGNSQDNVLTGNAGDDFIDGTGGNDTVLMSGYRSEYTLTQTSTGWSITDSISLRDGVDTLKNVEFVKFRDVTVSLAAGVPISPPAQNVVQGAAGGDTLRGTGANDVLRGLAGDDFLYSSLGDDVFDGGDGIDTVRFIEMLTSVQVDLSISGAQATGQGSDTFVSVENLVGGSGADTLRGDSGANQIGGYSGNDFIEGRGGNDDLTGDLGNDIIYGGDGNDTLRGDGGDDFLYGDAGADTFHVFVDSGPMGEDYIDGGTGADTLMFFSGGTGSASVTIDLSNTSRQQVTAGIVLQIRSIENVTTGWGNDTLIGDGADNVLSGQGGDDVIDGGAGADTVVLDGVFSNFVLNKTGNGWTITDKTPGQGGSDTVKNVEFARFWDRTISLASSETPPPVTTPPVITPPITTPPVTTPPVITPPAPTPPVTAPPTLTSATAPAAISNILRGQTDTGQMSLMAQTIANKLAAGIITPEAALREIVSAADATTSVATMSYQFFTGKVPSSAGLDYLVSSSGGNANNLSSAYYQSFSVENRYINFAVNLGKNGEGQAKFAADYGGLTLTQATKKAYAEIFGAQPSDAKVAALLAGGRDAYFASYGGDGPNGTGTKAAMVGWLLAEAEKADVGAYARANAAFLMDLADGAAYGVDLVGVYAKPEFAFSG